jgi:capsular exopolysaccharide synthesis family protein
LRFTDVEHDLRVMVVTSSVPDEGKTTVAANLALSLAQLGRTVLLVEGELRDPGVLELFGMPEGAGLTDVLLDNTPVSDVIQTLPGTELNLLAAGQVPPNPSELLGSRQMIGLLEELRASYETIIIDAPPLLPVTDAAVLAEHADGALLVVREGKTRKDQLARAKAALDAVEARVLGVVMNRARVPKTATTPYSQAANSSPARRRADARRSRTKSRMRVPREPHHHSRQAAEAKPLADSTR